MRDIYIERDREKQREEDERAMGKMERDEEQPSANNENERGDTER